MRRSSSVIAPVDSVQTLGELLTHTDWTVEDGELVFVRSTRQLFECRVGSNLVADGVTVIAPTLASAAGTYVWVLLASSGVLSSYAAYFNTASAGALGSGRLLDASSAQLAELTDGSKVWVRSVGDSYTWQAASTATADGLLVVNPTANGANPGRFVRDQVSSPVWALQLAWYIDPANAGASDENSGVDVGHPLKTAAEYDRRNRGQIKQVADYHIYVISDVAKPDYLRLSGTSPNGTVVHVHGSVTPGHGKTVVYTSVAGLTARTAAVPASNTRPSITDAAVPTGTWSGAGFLSTPAHPNFRIRLTSGAAAGAIAFPQKDETAGKVDVSYFSLAPANLFVGYWDFTLPTAQTPAVNDKFVVETLVQIDDFRIESDSSSDFNVNPSSIATIVDSIAFSGNGNQYSANEPIAMWGCVRAGGTIAGAVANSVFMACEWEQVACIGGYEILWQCHITKSPVPQQGGVVIVDGNSIAQAVPLGKASGNGELIVGDAASFDSTSCGIQQFDDGKVQLSAQFAGNTVWGTGAATVGLDVKGGALCSQSAGTYVITGTGGDFRLGGATSARAWNEGGGTWNNALTCTWAHLSTALGATGFGGNAHDVSTGAGIIRP